MVPPWYLDPEKSSPYVMVHGVALTLQSKGGDRLLFHIQDDEESLKMLERSFLRFAGCCPQSQERDMELHLFKDANRD